MIISVQADLDSGNLVMSQETHGKLESPDSIELHFGQFHKEMAIDVDNTIEFGTILIPSHLSNTITIPDLPYETRWDGHALHLGPVIGFMNHNIFYENPHWIASRFTKSNELKGLIFIFGKRHIDTKHRLIQGKYYDPPSKSFVEAIVPYPSVIYLRTNPSPKLYRHLKTHLGARNIYDYPFRSNKLEFWRCASQCPEVKRHLPDTCEYVSVENALEMLRKHRAVYLKPTNWSRGRGIYRLSWGKRNYVLADTYGRKWTFGDSSTLEQLLQEKMERPHYLIQEAVPFKYQGHKVDFRIYLQKDKAGKWQYRWMDTKVANQGSIISNFSNRYKIVPGEEALNMIFRLDKETVTKKVAEITQLCIKALKTMEDNGHSLGDVAMDFVLDKRQKVWLLEVQPDYYGDVFRLDYQAEYMHPNSFDYAKGLAGF